MNSTDTRRIVMKRAGYAALLAGVAALSGCLGPTYGTGKSQGAMLFDDLNNIVALGGSGDAEPIAYTEREALRTPENTSVLPAPRAPAPRQETAAEARARIQSAAYQGDGPVPVGQMSGNNPYVTQDYLDKTRGDGFSFDEVRSRDESGLLSPAELASRSERVKKLVAERNAASRTQRTMLSEPPLDYRRPSSAAPVGDPGVDEATKQRRMKGSESMLSKLGDLLPF